MELRTAEVRWFEAGPCPAEVADWFHRGEPAGEPERRTDVYLKLPDRDDLGVKLRGAGQLDLKMRTGALAGLVLPDGFAGRGETWAKWSFPLAPGRGLPGGEAWIAVEKVRWARWYRVAGDRTVTAVATGSGLADGGAAELVEIGVGRHRGWGFGFEAFGSALRAETVLEATVRAFARDAPSGGFPAVNSHSYPSWLRMWPSPE